MDSCICPPWPDPHRAALCRCLLPWAGCVAFIPSPWLSAGSDVCSLEHRGLDQVPCSPYCLGRQGPGWHKPGSRETALWFLHLFLTIHLLCASASPTASWWVSSCRVWKISALKSHVLKQSSVGTAVSCQQGRFSGVLICCGPLWWASWHAAHRPTFDIVFSLSLSKWEQ